MLKIDFHVHTWHSPDSNLSPAKLVERLRALKFSAVAVTNHDTLDGYEEVRKLAGDMLVFRGEEIKTKQGEIIALGISRPIEKGLEIAEACREIKRQHGFIIVPHPFDVLRKGVGMASLKNILDYVDAIEGINSRSYLSRFNRKAADFARASGKPLVAGSDSHFEMELGYAYTMVDSRKDKGSILKAVSEGKTEIFGSRSGYKPHVKTFLKKNLGIRL